MRFTEKLANLTIPQVLAIVAILLIIRFALTWNKSREEISPMIKSIAELAESLAVAMALVFLLIKPFIVQAFYIPSPSMHMTLLENDQLIVNKFIYRFKEPKNGDIVVFKAPPEATENGIEVDFIKRVIGMPGDEIRITPGYVLVNEISYSHRDLHYALNATDNMSKIKLEGNNVYLNGRMVKPEKVAASLGQEGARIKVVPGKVYRNGSYIDEPYIAEDCTMPYPLPGDSSKQYQTKDKDGNIVVKIPKGKMLVMGDNRNNSNDARFWGLLDRERIEGKAIFKFWPIPRIGLIK